MCNAKKIELFLANGTYNGVVTAEISYWSGKAIKIPRTEVKESKRDDITNPGVYFLLYEKDDEPKQKVYIGESRSVKTRLVRHINDYNAGKEGYWTTAIMFVSKDLNRTLREYLEKWSHDTMKHIGKYDVLTQNVYDTVIKEADEACMDGFINNMKILLKVMDYDFFEEPEKPNPSTIMLYCKSKKSGADATGFASASGFVVLKDSVVSNTISPSFESVKCWYNKRKELEENGTISNGCFVKDYQFNSPSEASAVILGKPSNGRVDWKTAEGTNLKDIK